MGKNGFEAAAFASQQDKTQDSQLAADQWDSLYREARDRSLASSGPNPNTVFDVVKMVPTTFAAFANMPRGSEIGYAQGLSPMQKTVGGLGIMFGANYLIDRTFFDDQPNRGGSLAFGFAAPAAIMFTPMAMRYKVLAGIGSHVVGKLLDKYGPPKLEESKRLG